MTISSNDKLLVQQSFSKVLPHAEALAERFYNRLFVLNPALKPLFKGDIKEQGRKLLQTLGVAVAALNNLVEVVPALQALGTRHVAYGVKLEDYDTVGSALIYALREQLGSDFTADVEAAWIAVYTALVHAATSNLYQETTATSQKS